MSRSGDVLIAWLVVICGLMLVISIGGIIGKVQERRLVYEEAVKAGAAVWVSDESGKPMIKWVVPNK